MYPEKFVELFESEVESGNTINSKKDYVIIQLVLQLHKQVCINLNEIYKILNILILIL